MKPILTKSDYSNLKTITSQIKPIHYSKEVKLLLEELTRVEVVKDSEIGHDILRINSYFEAIEEGTRKSLNFKLTLPFEADFKEKKISVLSPLGIALIGFKEGMTVECKLPSGTKKIHLIKVKNKAEMELNDSTEF
ncbi:MAG: GreA/GreB family elongation factor [Bacteroidetes bacterium]|nr:GreA/GreB family elongation factor [Bacteroidota bacterium]